MWRSLIGEKNHFCGAGNAGSFFVLLCNNRMDSRYDFVVNCLLVSLELMTSCVALELLLNSELRHFEIELL